MKKRFKMFYEINNETSNAMFSLINDIEDCKSEELVFWLTVFSDCGHTALFSDCWTI